MEAFPAFCTENAAESEKLNPGTKVAAPHVYTEVTALL
jgi:hypothetical protein